MYLSLTYIIPCRILAGHFQVFLTVLIAQLLGREHGKSRTALWQPSIPGTHSLSSLHMYAFMRCHQDKQFRELLTPSLFLLFSEVCFFFFNLPREYLQKGIFCQLFSECRGGGGMTPSEKVRSIKVILLI